MLLFVRKIEVEVESLAQVKEAVEAGADIIMLDNMTPEMMKEAVQLIDGRAKTEVFRKCYKRKYCKDQGCWCRLCIKWCINTFCTDP